MINNYITEYDIKNTNEMIKDSFEKTKITHIFPFVFTSGATTIEKSHQRLGQLNKYRRLLGGKDAVIVRWLNSVIPPKTINNKIISSFNKTDPVFFQAHNYTEKFFNDFETDSITGQVEIFNHKIIKLYLTKQQLNNWFGQSYSSFFGQETNLNINLDETWLSVLYYIPEVSKKDLFWITNAVISKDLEGNEIIGECELRSLTNELKQSGRSLEQWVNWASPGDKYLLPDIDKDGKIIYQEEKIKGGTFIQLDFDKFVLLNSIDITGRPVQADNSLVLPRMLGISEMASPVLNVNNKSNFYVKEYSMIKGHLSNIFFYEGLKSQYEKQIQATYDPLLKRSNLSGFVIDSFSDNTLDTLNWKKRLNWENWYVYLLKTPFVLPVKFWDKKISKDTYKYIAKADGTIQPLFESTKSIKSFIDFLNLNAMSYRNINEINFGSKIYSQNMLGMFANIITSGITSIGAGVGWAAGKGSYVGAAIGGFLGNTAGKVFDIFWPKWGNNVNIENPDNFNLPFLIPKILLDKLIKIYESNNLKIPLAMLLAEEDDFLKNLGVGKLPMTLTFRMSDKLANGKTSLNYISKDDFVDAKDNFKFIGSSDSYAIDFIKINSIGHSNVRISILDENKNIIFTNIQQTQNAFGGSIQEWSTETAISDYDGITNELPIGWNNVVSPKELPVNFQPIISKENLKDLDTLFSNRQGFDNLYSDNLKPENGDFNIEKIIGITTNNGFGLDKIFIQFPNFKIKLNLKLRITGSHHKTKIATSSYAYLPVINNFIQNISFEINKDNYNNNVNSSKQLIFDTTNFPTRQIKLVQQWALTFHDQIVYMNGKVKLQYLFNFQKWDNNNYKIKLSNFKLLRWDLGHFWELNNFSVDGEAADWVNATKKQNYNFHFSITDINIKTEIE